MVSARLRKTDLVVDLKALGANVQRQREQLAPGSRILAVVKANAYGNGMVPVASALARAGVEGFCVALLDEAIELRDSGIQELVLVLGITPVEYAPLAAAQGISLTVGSLEWLKNYQRLAKEEGIKQPLKVHLALDTGMGRIGFTTPEDFKEALQLVAAPYFEFEGIFTHFATADEEDATYFERQRARFDDFMAVVTKRPPFVHVANSATGLWHQKSIVANTIRMGISMYGANPSGVGIKESFPLEPVTSLVTHATYVKQLKAGESVSYGATYTAKEDEWVATLPVGYADGYPRRMQGFYVLVDGQRCEVLGRVCMDQMMVRLPKEYPVGTEAVLMGRSLDQEITVTDVAEYAHTINYEILTGMGARLHRRYLG